MAPALSARPAAGPAKKEAATRSCRLQVARRESLSANGGGFDEVPACFDEPRKMAPA